jgi:hypothetical protein
VDEDILAAVVADDEAEALLRLKNLTTPLPSPTTWGGMPPRATAAAAAAAAAATAAAAAAAAAAEAIATAEAAAAAIAAAGAPKPPRSANPAAVETGGTLFEEPVALVPAATATVAFTPSVETHARPKFPVPQIHENQRAGQQGATGLGAFRSRTVHSLTAKKRPALVIPMASGCYGRLPP